jgi:hypothetical protein
MSSRRKNFDRRRKACFPWSRPGIAAIASNASAGWLLDHGGIDLLYFICGAGAIVLGAASWWILPSSSAVDAQD